MKNLYIYIFFIAVSSMTAQTIMPLEQYSNGGEPDGIYFKDLNAILDDYTGTWRWTEGNKELTVYLYKDEEVTFINPIRGTYQRDVVFGYYIYKEGGTVLIDTKPDLLSNMNNRDYVQKGGVGLMPKNNGYDPNDLPLLYFNDYSRQKCWDGGYSDFVSGDPGFWGFVSENEAKIGLYTKGTHFTNCNGGINVVYPEFPSNSSVTISRISNTAPPLD